MRLLAGELPEEAGAFAGIMMQQRLVADTALLDFHRTQAHAADVLNAAVLDQAGDDVEGLVDVGGVIRLEAGHGGECLPPVADLGGKAVEPLRGAEIQIKIAAWIELGGDFVEAGFFRRDNGGCIWCGDRLFGRGRFLFDRRGLLFPTTVVEGDEMPAGPASAYERRGDFFSW